MIKHFRKDPSKDLDIPADEPKPNPAFDRCWTEVQADDWNEKETFVFIISQNSYSHDGSPPKQHSMEDLFKFAGFEDESNKSKFAEVYNSIYDLVTPIY